MRVTVDVDVDVIDVIRELDSDDLLDELNRRKAPKTGVNGNGNPRNSLMLVYEEFRRRGDAPEVLREYLYDMLGRILP